MTLGSQITPASFKLRLLLDMVAGHTRFALLIGYRVSDVTHPMKMGNQIGTNIYSQIDTQATLNKKKTPALGSTFSAQNPHYRPYHRS